MKHYDILKQYINTPNTYLLYCHVNIHRYCSYQIQQTHLACNSTRSIVANKIIYQLKDFFTKAYWG